MTDRGFQSTLPVGGATKDWEPEPPSSEYFNPRSPWGERHFEDAFGEPVWIISIHAPRGGSDWEHRIHGPKPDHISIHAPRGGSDGILKAIAVMQSIFQSTLPVGGATRPAKMV